VDYRNGAENRPIVLENVNVIPMDAGKETVT